MTTAPALQTTPDGSLWAPAPRHPGLVVRILTAGTPDPGDGGMLPWTTANAERAGGGSLTPVVVVPVRDRDGCTRDCAEHHTYDDRCGLGPATPAPASTPSLTAIDLDAWNATHPIGTPVLAWPLTRDDQPLATRTRSAAWLLGHGEPVVAVEGRAGCIALTHIARRTDHPCATACAEGVCDGHATPGEPGCGGCCRCMSACARDALATETTETDQ